MTDIMKLDLYLLLEIDSNANEQEIKKAYRKKALSCHPDKNPDNPKAAELFRQLSKALEILADKTARSAYDKLLRARKASQVRYRELDSKRRKLKDDLEAREKLAKEEVETEADAAAKLAKEIERLRKQGSKQLEEENELLKQQIAEELKLRMKKLPKIKVKRKSKNLDFTESTVKEHFSKFGTITCLVMSKKTAILEFADVNSVNRVLSEPDDLFAVELLDLGDNQEQDNLQNSQTTQIPDETVMNDFDSIENLVLKKMKQAQERKNLIQQMQQEEMEQENS